MGAKRIASLRAKNRHCERSEAIQLKINKTKHKKGKTSMQNVDIENDLRLADQGNASAQFNLCLCYCNGWGVAQNDAKAVEWCMKAANQGYADAQDYLGNCYLRGFVVSQDYVKGVEWCTKAANQGNAIAQFNLGYCYAFGKGITENHQTAKFWLQKAANQGYEKAKKVLEMMP
jgi:hypothetical protein